MTEDTLEMTSAEESYDNVEGLPLIGLAGHFSKTPSSVFNNNFSSLIGRDDVVKLYQPLVINPDKFISNYNIDIEDFVERHKAKEDAQNKGGANQVKRDILYMSYSHAIRLFRMNHPGLEVDCVRNPQTGGYLFEELDRRGYFVQSYVHDGQRRSATYYNALLTMSGQGINPDDIKSDYKTGKAKLTADGKTISVVDSQAINKAVYRAMVKAIALVTGIGLKLWTGDDLSEDILDAKGVLISNVLRLAEQYAKVTGSKFEPAYNLNYMSGEAEIKEVGRQLQLALNANKGSSEKQALVPTE